MIYRTRSTIKRFESKIGDTRSYIYTSDIPWGDKYLKKNYTPICVAGIVYPSGAPQLITGY